MSEPSHSPQTSHQLLADLLCELFNDVEFRRFISHGADTKVFYDFLPPVGTPLVELVDAFIGSADRRGVLGVDFFNRLTAVRPWRADDIAAVSQTFHNECIIGPSLRGAPQQGRWFSLTLRLGRIMILITLSAMLFIWLFDNPKNDSPAPRPEAMINYPPAASRDPEAVDSEATFYEPFKLDDLDATGADQHIIDPSRRPRYQADMGVPQHINGIKISSRRYKTLADARRYCSHLNRGVSAFRLAREPEVRSVIEKVIGRRSYWVSSRPLPIAVENRRISYHYELRAAYAVCVDVE